MQIWLFIVLSPPPKKIRLSLPDFGKINSLGNLPCLLDHLILFMRPLYGCSEVWNVNYTPK